MWKYVTAIALTVCATHAHAQPATLNSGGGGNLPVWKSAEATHEAVKLSIANADRSLFFPLMACIVLDGTAALVTSWGMATSDILIISGPQKGCRGNVTTERVRLNRN